jgi:hypothetical protein
MSQSKIYDLGKIGKVRIITLCVTLEAVAAVGAHIVPMPHCY